MHPEASRHPIRQQKLWYDVATLNPTVSSFFHSIHCTLHMLNIQQRDLVSFFLQHSCIRSFLLYLALIREEQLLWSRESPRHPVVTHPCTPRILYSNSKYTSVPFRISCRTELEKSLTAIVYEQTPDIYNSSSSSFFVSLPFLLLLLLLCSCSW